MGGVDQLADDVKNNATALKQMGYSLEDATLFMANLNKSGIDSSTVMTGLNKALQNATKDGKDMKTAMAELQTKLQNSKNDTDAMNLYERVKRGDVDQCSFGFDILNEETDFRDDGSVHWTIKEVELYEVSPCTFPAYEETNISARAKERDDLIKRKNEAWKEKVLKKLKGEKEC